MTKNQHFCFYATFIDDYSWFTLLYHLKHKSEFFNCVVMWHKNKIHMPNTWHSFVVCVPSLNNILYSISDWKVFITGYYSVWCKCKKNIVSQLGFLVLCFKPKTRGCKRGQSVLKGLSTGCLVTISPFFRSSGLVLRLLPWM